MSDYGRLNRYDMKVGEETKLIFPLNNSENNLVKYYMHNDEVYAILKKPCLGDYIKLFVV